MEFCFFTTDKQEYFIGKLLHFSINCIFLFAATNDFVCYL